MLVIFVRLRPYQLENIFIKNIKFNFGIIKISLANESFSTRHTDHWSTLFPHRNRHYYQRRPLQPSVFWKWEKFRVNVHHEMKSFSKNNNTCCRSPLLAFEHTQSSVIHPSSVLFCTARDLANIWKIQQYIRFELLRRHWSHFATFLDPLVNPWGCQRDPLYFGPDERYPRTSVALLSPSPMKYAADYFQSPTLCLLATLFAPRGHCCSGSPSPFCLWIEKCKWSGHW